MDYQKLDKKVSDLLRAGLLNKDYAEIREGLLNEGYEQDEVRYMMQVIDDKGIIPSAKEVQKDAPNKNIIIGGILCLISMITVGSLFLGQRATKEVYYVSLVIFVLGYYILRTGLKQRTNAKESQDP